MTTPNQRPETPEQYLRRYPRLCAHVIAESLGYATPALAAQIVKDTKEGRENHCEWILSCYQGDPRAAVERAIAHRHRHRGYMADYGLALAIIRRQIDHGDDPMFASWF